MVGGFFNWVSLGTGSSVLGRVFPQNCFGIKLYKLFKKKFVGRGYCHNW